MSLKKLKKQLLNHRYKLITVDIFDTLLLRKIYPEKQQFLLMAESAVKLLNEKLKIAINPVYFVSLRYSCRHLIDNIKEENKYDREAKLSEIFISILTRLSQKYKLNLKEEDKEQLIEQLITIELEIEKKSLIPNYELIKILSEAQKNGVKIYFLSDMYLSSNNIKNLLEHFNILSIFTDGFTSSDFGYSKGTSRLFKIIFEKNLIPEWNFSYSLHIGDNYISDYLKPQQLGIEAYFYQNYLQQCKKTIINVFSQINIKLQQKKYRQKIKQEWLKIEQKIKLNKSPKEQELAEIAFILSPAIIYFLDCLNNYSQLTQYPIYFLSGEGETFKNLLTLMGTKNKVYQLSSLNRKQALRSYAYLSLENPYMNTKDILLYFFMAEGVNSINKWLDSIGIKEEFNLPNLLENQINFDKFLGKVINLIKTNHKFRKPLEDAYKIVIKELEDNQIFDYQTIILSDIGWNGTIQILLEDFLQIIGHKVKVEGMYLGATGNNIFGLEQSKKSIKGVVFDKTKDFELFESVIIEEIWEFILNNKYDQYGQLIKIQKTIEEVIILYQKNIECESNLLFNFTKSKIEKLFTQPTKEQILILGSINHDAGFGSKLVRPIVDLNYPKKQLLKMMLFNRGKFIEIYQKQYWQKGFINWYQLEIFSSIYQFLKRIKTIFKK